MKVYQYHPITKEYLGENMADPSPLEPGVWLIPGHAVATCPPLAEGRQTPIWSGSEWVLREDYRGEIEYDPDTGEQIVIESFDVMPRVVTPPPTTYRAPKYIDGAWVDSNPVTERETALNELSATDMGMIRVIEDIVAVLTPEQQAALPAVTKSKLQKRQELRSKLSV